MLDFKRVRAVQNALGEAQAEQERLERLAIEERKKKEAEAAEEHA